MAGRKFPKPDAGGAGRRPQAAKPGSGRRGGPRPQDGGAPRRIRSGRGRVDPEVREGNWLRRGDEELENLANSKKLGESRKRLEATQEARDFGARLEGVLARATVLEVRKGNFLAELKEMPALPEGAPPIPKILRVVPRGTLQQFDLGLASLVAAGDEVELVVSPANGEEENEAVLARVIPRTSEFRRLHPSGRSVQTLAANVSAIAIVASTAEPDFRPGFVDRVLACGAASDLPALLVLNKTDLGVPEDVQTLLDTYRALGVRALETSARSGTGLDALRAEMAGKRLVFCGHSGVGKSSLLIALAPELEPDVRIGEVSTYTSKGTHTTTHARLYRAAGGEVIDTPGVREFTPADTDRKNLWAWFPELASRQGQCGFDNCTHTVEKGCAVLQAVRDGKIHPRRHESYVRMYETLPA